MSHLTNAPSVPAPATTTTATTRATRQAALEVRALNKKFTRSDGVVVNAVDSTSLTVESGEFLVLLGPSGCGKSTFLRCLAGLESPQLGSIHLGDRVLFDGEAGINLPPERRGVSMVFQSYALWPHMSVFKNVAYPLTASKKNKVAKAEVTRRVQEVLDLVGIGHLSEQYPSQISGGQQQRVALARALVQGSDIVLFDEPLSNVDARVRDQLRTEIRQMQQRLGFTAVYVTHDQEEALSLADRIAVIDSGAVAQLGTPEEIFLEPSSMKVARFVGNLVEIEGTVSEVTDEHVIISSALGSIIGRRTPGTARPGDKAWATWRPDRTQITAAPEASNSWLGEVRDHTFMGNFTDVTIKVADQIIHHRRPNIGGPDAGTAVTVSVAPDDVRILTV